MLGVDCEVVSRKSAITLQVDAGKAARWARMLEAVVATGVMDPGQASKIAGRLSFAVTASAGKVGRAFVRPFFAQAHDPLPGNRASPQLMRACEWFVHYLSIRPPFRWVPWGFGQSRTPHVLRLHQRSTRYRV